MELKGCWRGRENTRRLEKIIVLLDEIEDLVWDVDFNDHVKDSLVSFIPDRVKLVKEAVERVKNET